MSLLTLFIGVLAAIVAIALLRVGSDLKRELRSRAQWWLGQEQDGDEHARQD